MRLLKHLRSRSRLNNNEGSTKPPVRIESDDTTWKSWKKPDPTAPFTTELLQELLTYVCPHTKDDSLLTCDASMSDGGCMLCDMKDLAQCALVNSQWAEAASNLLYHNIRIDAVHYCHREEELAMRRRRPSFIGRHGDYKDPPQKRLQLFCRTVRENRALASRVQYLKISYMTREGSMSDLARIISVLRNLRFVDLPDALYGGDSSADILKEEIQRCTELRQMKYMSGAEGNFESLAHLGQWKNLEALELSHLAVESSTVVQVLASLGSLQHLKMEDLQLLDDTFFTTSLSNPSLPPVTNMALQDIPNITVAGLVEYLSQTHAGESLATLSLRNTGILPAGVPQILSAAPRLFKLQIMESVSRVHPSAKTPTLASRSLRILHYEISNTNSSSPQGLQKPADSYYTYLSNSILSGSLPSLSDLYALSPTLPTLLLPAPQPALTSGTSTRTGAVPPPLALNRFPPLNLYTKSVSEMEWQLTIIVPPTVADRRGSVITVGPESLLTESPLSPGWRNKGRESVMVGNGFGGFLAVPSPNDSAIPGSPRRKKKQDLDSWMG